jgi:hypothetical protein
MNQKRQFDIISAIQVINSVAHDARNGYGDFAWGAKQDLYRLKWLIEEILNDCQKFTTEDAWLKHQEQIKLIRILRDERLYSGPEITPTT